MIVSIVIATASGEGVASRCIASIRRLAGAENAEIIVLPCEQASIFLTRAEGIERATGDRIAILGDRYEVTADWLNAVLRECDLAVASGSVAPGSDLTYWGWCVYFCEYAHVAPPVVPGETTQPKLVAGGNVVYSRAIMQRFPPSGAKNELSFHSSLIGASVKVRLCPELEVRFAMQPGIGEYLQERFHHSQAIGIEGGLFKLVVGPLLPLLVPLRIGAAVLRSGRYLPRFLLCLPVILWFGFVQAAGEFSGALRGFRKLDGRQ
jgi:hypothetical protein